MSTESEPSTKVQRASLSAMALVTFFFLVSCAGMAFLVQTLFQLGTGWIPYLKRTLPTLTVSASGVLWFLFCLALFVTGLHLACRGVYRGKQETAAAEENRSWQLRWSFSLVALLLVLVTSGICLIGVSHQLWWMATGKDRLLYQGGRTAMRRSVSKNNLRQIGLGLHLYEDAHDRLPDGGTFSETGQPQHGWVAQLLPFMDQEDLYQQIDFHQPWTDEVNRKPYETRLPMLVSPGTMSDFIQQEVPRADNDRYPPAHYAANSRVLGINSRMSLRDITDGTSNTIFAGEVREGIRAWGSPLNYRDPARGINQQPDSFGSHFIVDNITGAQMLFGDGSVRFVSDDIDPEVLKRLSTPAGAEVTCEDWMEGKPVTGRQNRHD
ncbi:DUF1559 domain-containing protein [Gimesia chilikensis]|uniref:DUF1559 domain-containing protein n=1 Tax=Gimesia chilikensis TaxID=2605989 RepID=UPI003A925AC3